MPEMKKDKMYKLFLHLDPDISAGLARFQVSKSEQTSFSDGVNLVKRS